jgi:hypothetical protein
MQSAGISASTCCFTASTGQLPIGPESQPWKRSGSVFASA